MKPIIRLLLFFPLYIACITVSAQGNEGIQSKSYVVEKILFKTIDSTYNYSHIISYPYRNFIPYHLESNDTLGQVSYSTNNPPVQTYFEISNNIVELESKFPYFSNDSNRLIVNYEYIDKAYFPMVEWNLKYSLILARFNEKALDTNEIRLIFPAINNSDRSNVNMGYVSINLDSYILKHSEGYLSHNNEFKISICETQQLTEKDIKKIEKELAKIDLNKETYYAEKGIHIHWKFLIEFYSQGNYYAFERADENAYNRKNQYKKLKFLIVSLCDR